MDFRFTDEQLMIAETARKLLAGTCSMAQLRAMLAAGEARDRARWAGLVETGLTATLLPEPAGLGLTETDFILVAQAAGYAALPEPLVESSGIAAPLLAAIDPAHDLLSSELTLAIGPEINPFIADADTAAALLLERDGATYLLRPEDVTLTRQQSTDPFRRLFSVDWRPNTPHLPRSRAVGGRARPRRPVRRRAMRRAGPARHRYRGGICQNARAIRQTDRQLSGGETSDRQRPGEGGIRQAGDLRGGGGFSEPRRL